MEASQCSNHLVKNITMIAQGLPMNWLATTMRERFDLITQLAQKHCVSLLAIQFHKMFSQEVMKMIHRRCSQLRYHISCLFSLSTSHLFCCDLKGDTLDTKNMSRCLFIMLFLAILTDEIILRMLLLIFGDSIRV